MMERKCCNNLRFHNTLVILSYVWLGVLVSFKIIYSTICTMMMREVIPNFSSLFVMVYTGISVVARIVLFPCIVVYLIIFFTKKAFVDL